MRDKVCFGAAVRGLAVKVGHGYALSVGVS